MSDERSGVLTKTERLILLAERDVSGENYFTVISRIRKKIDQVTHGLRALKEHEVLGNELRDVVCHDAG